MNMHRSAITLTTSLILLLACTGLAHAIGVNDGFDPNVNNPVRTIVQQRNGGLLIGGQFSSVGTLQRNLVARIRANGVPNLHFNPDVDGDGARVVFALHEQADFRVLIGGRFASVGGQPRANIARVTSSGVLDTTFNPAVDGDVHVFASQVSGDGLTGFIYAGGEFNKVNGEQREGIVRLLADGSLDTSFVPPAFNGGIHAIKMQPDGRLLVAGTFSMIDGFETEAPVARLNVDGSFDPTFSTQLSRSGHSGGIITNLAMQPDGKILIAGYFDEVGGQQRKHIARLHANGALDQGFIPPDSIEGIEAMVLQEDGRIVIAGSFFTLSFYRGVARLYPDGSYDPGFVSRSSAMTSGAIYAMAQQGDGNYVVGGQFSQIGGHSRNFIARLDDRGTPDADLIANLIDGPDSSGKVVAVQADGKILLGGDVATSGNSRLTRLHVNGQRDVYFSSFVNGAVNVIIAQPDEKIVIAGSFDNVGGHIARLNADGGTDSTFVANANGGVAAGALQRNGRIVVAGGFTKINGVPRSRLARLLPSGTTDLSFNSNVNGNVFAVVIQPDGKILIGGDFTKVGGLSRTNIARLHVNGLVDAGFEADVDDTVRSIAVDANGRILIGGRFDTVGGMPRAAIARLLPDGSVDPVFVPDDDDSSGSIVVYSLALLSNEQIVIGGEFATQTGVAAFLRRLSKDGVEDGDFGPEFQSNSSVYSVVVQPDGKVLFAGNFSTVDSKPRNAIARYASTGFAMALFRLGSSGSDLTWYRYGYAPELTAPPVVLWSTTCCDRGDFIPLPSGVMQRASYFAQVWELRNFSIPGTGTVWLRAVSIAGDGGRSVIPIESSIIAVELDGISDRIFADGFE